MLSPILTANNLTAPLTQPQWRAFELSVAEIVARMDLDAVVRHDVTLTGKVSGVARQVDVLVTGSIGGQTMSIAIECKQYTPSCSASARSTSSLGSLSTSASIVGSCTRSAVLRHREGSS